MSLFSRLIQIVVKKRTGLHEKSGIKIYFRLAEITSISGLTRETTARITSHLRKDGILESNHDGIKIVDIDKLKKLKKYYPIL